MRIRRAPSGVIRSRSGIALLMVLWVLVMLSVISLGFVSQMRLNTAGTRNLKDETVAYYLAVSGYNEAVRYILADKDPSVDFIDSEGHFWNDSTAEESPSGVRTTGEGEVEIRIIDENAKLNINSANSEQLVRLLESAGVPAEAMNTLIDSMLDWKDADTEHHLSGAEDDYYEDLTDPYPAKNAVFDVPEELALVKGFGPDALVSPETARTIAQHVTTFGPNTLNINTASPELMRLLGMNDFEIEAVLKQRTREIGGFRFIPPQFTLYGFNSVVTSTFRIEVTARVQNSPLAAKVVAVVSRMPYPDGPRIHTLYWSERVESVRS